MTDNQLNALFAELLHQYFPRKKYEMDAAFCPNRSVSHTIQLKRKRISVKIAETFRDVPAEILQLLGHILLAKISRYKVDRNIRSRYNQYIRDHVLPKQPVRRRKPSSGYSAIGTHFNLESLFDTLNENYFEGRLKKPVLGWSLNNSYRRLGFYVAEKNLMVISRIFDQRRVPQKVVEALLYHEMLHIRIPVQEVNGRRRIHTPEFRKLERAFPGYDEARYWIKKNLHRL